MGGGGWMQWRKGIPLPACSRCDTTWRENSSVLRRLGFKTALNKLFVLFLKIILEGHVLRSYCTAAPNWNINACVNGWAVIIDDVKQNTRREHLTICLSRQRVGGFCPLGAQISPTELEMKQGFFFCCLMSRNLNFCMNVGRAVSNVCLCSAHSCVLIALSEWRPVHPTQQVSLQSGVEWTRLLQVISDNTTNEEDSLKTPNKHELQFQTRAWMPFVLLFAGKGNRTITSKDSTQLHVNHPMKGILV